MAVCCCSLAGTAACQHCASNPFATDVWANKTVTVDHVEAKPFGNGIDACPVCGKPSTIGKPRTNADRIRSMTDEELAEFLHSQFVFSNSYLPSKWWLDWLKEEAEGVGI